MCLVYPTQAWLLAGATLPSDSVNGEWLYRAQGSELLFVCNVPWYWQYWLEEVTLNWLAGMEYADRMADALVAWRRLPPHVAALTPVIRKIAEFL